jgi:hypothetical protein
MNDQRLRTDAAISEDATLGQPGSTLQAHLIGIGALVVAIGLFLMFDFSMEMGRGLFIVAIIVYAQFYNEAAKHKVDR